MSAALTCTDHALEFLSTLSQLEKLEAVGEPSVASSQQPVELASLLDRCVTIAAPQLAQGVAMRISSKDVRELWVRVDSVVLSEVLINLLQARQYPSDRARICALVPTSYMCMRSCKSTTAGTKSGGGSNVKTISIHFISCSFRAMSFSSLLTGGHIRPLQSCAQGTELPPSH